MPTQNATLDAWFADVNGGSGAGNTSKMMVGKGTSSWAFQNRFGLSFPRGTLFAGVPSASAITKFEVNLKVDDGNSGIGSAVNFYLERGTTAFTEVQLVAGQDGVPAGGNLFPYVINTGPATGRWPGPTRVQTNPDRGHYPGTPAEPNWIKVNCLDIGKWWYDNPSVNNLVLVGIAADETLAAQRCTFTTRETSSKPYVELVAGGNVPPDKPTVLTSSLGFDGTTLTITAKYTDANGDTSTQFRVRYEAD